MVKIDDVIEALEIFITDGDHSTQIYYNLKTFAFEYIPTIYSDSTFEEYEDETTFLPFYHDLYSSEIIKAFIDTISDSRIRGYMNQLFNGKGKYRRIKEYIYHLGIIDDYYTFTHDYLKREAYRWCEENNIPYQKSNR